ncbi:MAG: DUF3160 domain-containing protein [Chloroflexi bacterium]|nr:DUF3160 domain-containing protein [Chloroflexota bacterium]MCI0650168.1 DUF3160 domain-containing protein [Chloroflexota bacterium]MCI0729521.1 DUF3160 domain-containing protein [Chloroflexota bacterium]
MKKLTIVYLFLTSFLLLALSACGLLERATATPQPTAAATAVAATPTIPPVQSPTIQLPPTPATEPPAPATEEAVAPPVSGEITPEQPRFAVYNEPLVDVVPAAFHDPIAPDLGNVVVPFALSEDQQARLAQDGLVVNPGVEKEFFTVYEQARYENLPVFVTSDSLLHVYHLLFDKVLRTAETGHFIPLLRELNKAMLAQTEAQYQELQGTPWEEAARRTVAFIGVGSWLLDPAVEIPDYAAELVEAELAQVEAASGILPSPLFPGLENGEDYTQYIPRGHYTRSEELTAYFKSMMWYGRMTFRLTTRDPEVGQAETRSALLLVHGLRTAQVQGRPALNAWLDLYNPTVFFVGRSDDLTALQYLAVVDAVYGPEASLATLADDARLDTFIDLANQLPPPQILGLVISVDDDVEETTKGFRFMGQRFVPDAYIFRQLIYRNVGTPDRPRMLPKGLDVMAAMGSERAYTILTQLGETGYQNYPEQMAKVQGWVSDLSTEEWTETLYTTWIYSFQPLLAEPGEGYPQFMQSDAWLDKQLNTTLGSWAELKHDTILYAKQVYAELGGGGEGPPSPRELLGYVEPVPQFYARLAALTAMTTEGLDSRGLLSDQDRNSLERLESVARSLQTMAEKELRGEPLTEDEYRFIRFYGGELEHLTMAAADTTGGDEGGQPVLDEEPQAAVVADVATAPDPDGDGVANPVVLEEAVGRINEIYVVVPIVAPDGSTYLQVNRGGVFAYYEFTWPADDRLTDESWRQMLDEGQAPPLPEWTSTFFTAETTYAEFRRTVYAFQRSLSEAVWWREIEYLAAGDEVKAQFEPAIADLAAANHYEGRQWINASYRSFDRQSDELVVVTVRETWQDTLYRQMGDSPSFDDEVIGARGPYTLDVTYTLELQDGLWQVTRVVYANEPPAWE